MRIYDDQLREVNARLFEVGSDLRIDTRDNGCKGCGNKVETFLLYHGEAICTLEELIDLHSQSEWLNDAIVRETGVSIF